MFHNARLTLTLWYLLIIMLISAAFSVVIYRALTVELERFSQIQKFRIERRLQERQFIDPSSILPILQDLELIEETKRRLAITLVFINGVILLLSGTFGYILAGRTLRPIQHMVDEQHRFISDASHELRTPLTSLKTSLEVYLRDKQLTLHDAKDVIRESIADVNYLQALTDNLLTISKYDNKHIKLHVEKISFRPLVDQAIHLVEPLAKEKHISFTIEGADSKFIADRASILNVLTILLDNAIKYSSEAQTIKIVSKIMKKKSFQFQVIDHGFGISEKDIPHVFDRFYQADQSRNTTSGKGYGLGLSIAKTIVDLHNGTIEISSTIQKGTTVTVSLPLSH